MDDSHGMRLRGAIQIAMTDADKPKIIVDEDWKSQVQAEKEAAKSAPHPAAGSAEVKEPPDVDLPPASLTFLCTTLATQAMIALGQVPNPITGKVELRLKQAKHHIDTLGVLEEKTTGNRTPEENSLFTELLHQLRMAYVMMQSAPESAASA
jgi:hypothetical protein